MRHSLRALILLSLAPVACATRSVPEQEAPRSPASLAAPSAPPAAVTTALEGDPPLPGEPEGNWKGLREEAPASQEPANEGPSSGHEHSEPPEDEGHDHHPPEAPAPNGHEHHHHHHHDREAPDATP